VSDDATKRWTLTAADERAVAAGCRFNEERGQFVIDWVRDYCRLYEGECAGQPLVFTDWQAEVTMQLFGWERFSERWGRWVRRFNRASIWVPKKNKKSPTLAAWGLYLLCGDSEQGQKVYLGAKDGAQAREVCGKHAIEMVLSSPALMSECTINRSSMQVTHERTRSLLKPMSSNDSRTQQSKEGINGSILIDETHVVDADFISRVSRAGISRSEPLHAEVSTAGKEPQSYGKRQWDYGQQVERGDVDDMGFLFRSWAAPQTLGDDELHADPLKYGRMANPAWGHTVGEEEFLADYNRSRQSISDLADFKTYRLNIWQKSRNPWLKASDWDKCADVYTLERFAGCDCWAGLDKSKTRDLTALVLIFQGDEPEQFYQWPLFWLPQATAERENHNAPFVAWARAGHLNLIPGEVITDSAITEVVRELSELVRIQEVIYDRTFAHDITATWEQELGIPRLEFPQTTMNFAGPIEDYERLVIQGNLKHPNQPLLNWQAGHCETYTDSKGRKTLVKPRHGDIKKIDGMVAGVMALSRARMEANKPQGAALFLTA
jgi:phage terminase large subunit-like protein